MPPRHRQDSRGPASPPPSSEFGADFKARTRIGSWDPLPCSKEPPLCPFSIAYRRAYGFSYRRTVPFSLGRAIAVIVGRVSI